LIVTGVGNQLEGDEPMGKGEDANQVKSSCLSKAFRERIVFDFLFSCHIQCASMVQELKELEHNEETQSIAKEAIDENSQQVADTEVSMTNITPH